MTMDEYFDFLEQYWQMFEPPTQPLPKKEYQRILI